MTTTTNEENNQAPAETAVPQQKTEYAVREPHMIHTMDDLQDEFDKFLLLADRTVVKATVAAVIANRIPYLDPLWLFLVAPSSGGKTEIINTIEGLPFVFPIDTLTANTFASGQTKPGQETSLLFKLPGNTGIFTFKDFTVVLNMNPMAREEIMGQLRAIFDGTFVKRTGAGKDIEWRGKVGMVAAVTSIIHQRQAEFSSMGERFVQYEIAQPDRRAVQEKKFERRKYGLNDHQIREHLRACTEEFITRIVTGVHLMKFEMHKEDKDKLYEISDYCTRARSGLEKNWAGSVDFIPDAEMPTRVNTQLVTLAHGLMAINQSKTDYDASKDNSLGEEDMAILYKVALDSIPRKRRQALRALAEYALGVTSAGVAIATHYDTAVMKQVMFELNALGLCDRIKDGSTDKWSIVEEWRDIVLKFERLKLKQADLTASDISFNGTLRQTLPDPMRAPRTGDTYGGEDTAEYDELRKEENRDLWNMLSGSQDDDF